MNAIIFYFMTILALVLLSIFLSRARRIRSSLLCVVFLFLLTVDILSFGMGRVRADVIEARKNGRSEDFIAGMLHARNENFPRRVELFLCVCGLAVLAVVAIKRK